MFARGLRGAWRACFVVSSLAIACGSVDQGRVEIVDEEDAGAGSGAGGKQGAAGTSAGGSSGSAGSSRGGSDSPGGDGGDGPAPVLPEPPVVVSVTPSDGETAAEPTDSIRIEFSEQLDPSTVTNETVRIMDGDVSIPGSVSLSGVTVEFTPDARLDLLGSYEVIVGTEVTDSQGTALSEQFTATFSVRDGSWQEELVVQNTAGALSRRLVSPVIDAAGNALIVWAQAKNGESVASVFGRSFSPGNGWGEAFELDQASVACDDVSVAMNHAGEAVVAWTQKAGASEEVWTRRISQGELASAAARVDAGLNTGVTETQSAVSATGRAHVFWSVNDTGGGTKRNVLASNAPLGEEWLAPPAVLYNAADSLSSPGVAFDDDGNGFMFVAFDYSSDSNPAQLYARRFLESSRQWGNGAVIADSDDVGLFDPPSVVTDSRGGARAVFAVGADVKLVTFSKAAGFSAAIVIDTLDSNPSSIPKLSSNGEHFLATWYQSASLTTNAYSAFSDGDAFAEPELRSNGDYRVGYYGNPVSGLDRHGNALVLFEQGNAADTVDIVFDRLTSSAGEWSDGSLVNSLDSAYQDPRIAVASNGVAVAAWSQGIRLTANSIFVSTFE
jgi:Bacterial Ig-like domain